MRMNKLGHSGLFVSELCLGTMTFGGSGDIWSKIGALQQSEAEGLVGAALDAGINFIDTADVYSNGLSEEITGQALKTLKVGRSDIVVATKAFGPTGESANTRGSSRSHLIDAVKGSLKRLQTDYIDLYQLHGFDAATPDGRDAARARHARAARPRPLHRRVELGGVAHRQSPRHLRAARPRPLPDVAGLLHGGGAATSSARSCPC